MKAMRIHEFGGPDVLQWDEIPMPEAGPDQVVVRVHAAAVNPVDGKIRTGKFKRFRPRLPATLGRDFSGVIAQVGEEVTGWKVGDEVFGMTDYARGTYAEYCVALPSEMALKPTGLDHGHAACIGVAGLTAWQALFRYGELHTSKRVLVHGGGGGVGHLAVQFATGHGAEVITTVSTEDLDFASSLGAAEVIDYKTERFEELVRDVDLVIDLIDGETRQRSWQVMKQGGILVSTLSHPDAPASAPMGVRGREVIVECHNEQMLEIAFQAADGLVRIEVDRVFPLEQVEQAHEHLENEHVRGKTVLEVVSD